jgi:hypothetical protein
MDRRRGEESQKGLGINAVDISGKLKPFYGRRSEIGRNANRALLFSQFGPRSLPCFSNLNSQTGS